MKKYIQLTAGRGPVECARAVALVARELLKDFPDAENKSGAERFSGVRHQTVTVPAILAGTGLSVWNSLNPSHFRMCRIKTLCMKQCAREDTEDRT